MAKKNVFIDTADKFQLCYDIALVIPFKDFTPDKWWQCFKTPDALNHKFLMFLLNWSEASNIRVKMNGKNILRIWTNNDDWMLFVELSEFRNFNKTIIHKYINETK